MKKIIPSIFTCLNLLCGFFAIVLGDIYIGAILLCFALVLDLLDGATARKLGVASDLGKELDSFADLISFGIAPAYLYTLFSPIDHWTGYIPVGIYVLGATVRLARFNLLPSSKFFKGLASPPAAFFMIGVFFGIHFNEPIILGAMSNAYLYAIPPIALAILMNCNLKMFSLKGLNSGLKRDKIYPLLVFSFFLILLFIDSTLAIPLSIFFYLAMAVIYNLTSKGLATEK